MISFFDRSVDKLELLIKEELNTVFNEQAVPHIKQMLLTSYAAKLEGVVDSEYNFIKPEFYRQFFEERLEEFPYVIDNDSYITLRCPDEDNFDLSGNLAFIHNIVNGLQGNYYKVHLSTIGVYDEDDVFIIAEDNDLLRGVDLSNLSLFEFSNSEPIDLFAETDEFVSENIDTWVSAANEEAVKKYENYMKGVNIQNGR